MPGLRVRRRVVAYAGLTCPHCAAPLDAATLGSGTASCARCRGSFEHERFTPRERPVVVAGLADAGPEGAAACGAHARNVAQATCTRCGVFMCGLCATASDGMTLCPPCFNRLAREQGLESLKTTFVDYGARASSAAVAGVLFCMPFGWALGALALYYGVRGLRQKTESVGSRGGIALAMLLGLVELLASFLTLAGMWLH